MKMKERGEALEHLKNTASQFANDSKEFYRDAKKLAEMMWKVTLLFIILMEKIELKQPSRKAKFKAMIKPYASTKIQQFYLVLTLVLLFMTVPLYRQC